MDWVISGIAELHYKGDSDGYEVILKGKFVEGYCLLIICKLMVRHKNSLPPHTQSFCSVQVDLRILDLCLIRFTTIGGSNGAPETGALPLGPIFFIFMQFFLGRGLTNIIVWRPHLGVDAPSSGKSLICHWETIFSDDSAVLQIST